MCLRGYVDHACAIVFVSLCVVLFVCPRVYWNWKLCILISTAVMKEFIWTSLSCKMHILWCISGHNIMTRVIRLHFKPIYTSFLPHVLQLQCNNLPHENCYNLPQGGIFARSTCQSNTHAHKAVIISSIYITGILRFSTLSTSRCSWIFLAQGKFSKM